MSPTPGPGLVEHVAGPSAAQLTVRGEAEILAGDRNGMNLKCSDQTLQRGSLKGTLDISLCVELKEGEERFQCARVS